MSRLSSEDERGDNFSCKVVVEGVCLRLNLLMQRTEVIGNRGSSDDSHLETPALGRDRDSELTKPARREVVTFVTGASRADIVYTIKPDPSISLSAN